MPHSPEGQDRIQTTHGICSLMTKLPFCHEEALKTRSVSHGHQWFVGFAARPCPNGPSGSLSRHKFLWFILLLKEILQQNKTPSYLMGSSVVKSRTQQGCLVCLSLKDETRGTLERLSNGTNQENEHVCTFWPLLHVLWIRRRKRYVRWRYTWFFSFFTIFFNLLKHLNEKRGSCS